MDLHSSLRKKRFTLLFLTFSRQVKSNTKSCRLSRTRSFLGRNLNQHEKPPAPAPQTVSCTILRLCLASHNPEPPTSRAHPTLEYLAISLSGIERVLPRVFFDLENTYDGLLRQLVGEGSKVKSDTRPGYSFFQHGGCSLLRGEQLLLIIDLASITLTTQVCHQADRFSHIRLDISDK